MVWDTLCVLEILKVIYILSEGSADLLPWGKV